MNEVNNTIQVNRTPIRVISVPDAVYNKKWHGYSRSQLEDGIKRCYHVWVNNGKPRVLDSYMSDLVVKLPSNHAKYKEYGFIGRKVMLSAIRRMFTRNDSAKINHFLLIKNNGLERIDHLFTTLVKGIIDTPATFDINTIQEKSKHQVGDIVLYEEFLNTLLWSDNKLSDMLHDRMFVVDTRFNTEDLSYRKPTRLKDFRNFLFNSKDLKRESKGIGMHYSNRSFYYVGVTWEKRFIDSYRKMFNDAKVANMAYPLVIDLMSYEFQTKVEYMGKKYIDLQFFYENVQNIVGEAYARVILGEDIPKESFTAMNKTPLKDYEALAYFDGKYVENWNVVEKDNTLGIPIFEL